MIKEKINCSKYLYSLVFLLSITTSFSQVGIGTIEPSEEAKLDVVSNSKGVLLPRMNSEKMNGLTKINSLLIYNIDVNKFMYCLDNEWYYLDPWFGDTNSIFTNADQVGINTSNPKATLEINGDLRLTPTNQQPVEPSTIYFSENRNKLMLFDGTDSLIVAYDSDNDGLIEGKDPNDSEANDFDANPEDVLENEKFWCNGEEKIGIMKKYSMYTVVTARYKFNIDVTIDLEDTAVYIEQIYIPGSNSLHPQNIKSGVTIFGIDGAY